MSNFASGSVARINSVTPNPYSIASGAIAQATIAGFDPKYLIPVLPPNLTVAEHCGSELRAEHCGKTPATYDRNSGLWRARRGWAEGVPKEELEICDGHGANVGLRLGVGSEAAPTFVFADFDTEPGDDPGSRAHQVAQWICRISLEAVTHAIGRPVWVRETRPGRMGVLFCIEAGEHAGTKSVIQLSHGERKLGKLEVLARGQQVVIGGVHPYGGGTPIRWYRSDRPKVFQAAPTMKSEDFKPLQSREVFNAIMRDVVAALERVGFTCSVKTPLQGNHLAPQLPLTAEAQAAPSAARLIDLLHRLPHDASVDYDSYVNFMRAISGTVRAMRTLDRLRGDDEARIIDAAIEWATRWDDPNGHGTTLEDMRAKWDQDFSQSPADRLGWEYLEGFGLRASLPGLRIQQAQDVFEPDLEPVPDKTRAEDSVEASDDELALKFAKQQVGHLVHIEELGGWHNWTGSKWRRGANPVAFTPARRLCRAEGLALQGREPRLARSLASKGTVAAVVSLASTDPSLSKRPEDFDLDPMELNTPAGVVDLRTGKLRQHHVGDLFLKEAGVAPGGSCPRWLQFLQEITQGDQDVISYLKRWAGYMLTGDTQEHAFLFLFGPGGNGKSVLMDILSMVMGDYATPAMASVFTKTRSEAHSTEMAALRGARLVTLNEVDQGSEWAEARLKELTGVARSRHGFLAETRLPSGRSSS